tara:strand:+ start:129 stop:446 length:318 start_codon:yes stop_codon:yes gene_type:complete
MAETEKQIVEITEEMENCLTGGLITRLSFRRGLKTERGRFFHIDVSSCEVVVYGEERYYETIALGRTQKEKDDKVVYGPLRTDTQPQMEASHWGVVEQLKRSYLS